jgi:hypothetical protein
MLRQPIWVLALEGLGAQQTSFIYEHVDFIPFYDSFTNMFALIFVDFVWDKAHHHSNLQSRREIEKGWAWSVVTRLFMVFSVMHTIVGEQPKLDT